MYYADLRPVISLAAVNHSLLVEVVNRFSPITMSRQRTMPELISIASKYFRYSRCINCYPRIGRGWLLEHFCMGCNYDHHYHMRLRNTTLQYCPSYECCVVCSTIFDKKQCYKIAGTYACYNYYICRRCTTICTYCGVETKYTLHNCIINYGYYQSGRRQFNGISPACKKCIEDKNNNSTIYKVVILYNSVNRIKLYCIQTY